MEQRDRAAGDQLSPSRSPVTLADSGTQRAGGSWGPDGYLYFGSNLPGRLVRVAEGGGAPEAVTMIDTTQGEVWYAWPEALHPWGRV